MPVKRVLFHLLVKLRDMGGVAPRFVSYLTTDTLCEPRTPAQTWKGCINAVASIFMHEIAKVVDSVVFARVVVQSGELD